MWVKRSRWVFETPVPQHSMGALAAASLLYLYRSETVESNVFFCLYNICLNVYFTVSLKPQCLSSVILPCHLFPLSCANRDAASGQDWQNGVIILVFASAYALPFIHFTASLLIPEGERERDHVREKKGSNQKRGRFICDSALPHFTSPLSLIQLFLMVYQMHDTIIRSSTGIKTVREKRQLGKRRLRSHISLLKRRATEVCATFKTIVKW